jgi:hypothetical protein
MEQQNLNKWKNIYKYNNDGIVHEGEFLHVYVRTLWYEELVILKSLVCLEQDFFFSNFFDVTEVAIIHKMI